jgi:signal transduction histidine kinase/ActR/RegA family two-component response regulator
MNSMFPPIRHLRTRLLLSLLAVVFLLTVAVLTLIRVRLRAHVAEDLASSLRTELSVYSEVEEARRQQAEQSVALISNLPSLKALVSTGDVPTIQDGSESILRTSGADLLLLESSSGDLLAVHSKSGLVPTADWKSLLLGSPGKHDWWLVDGHLYSLNFAALSAGADSERRFLGRVALGREVTPQSIAGAQPLTDRALIFEREGMVLTSSLKRSLWPDVQGWLKNSGIASHPSQEMFIGGERCISNFIELPGDHPIHLYSLRSYDQATIFLSSLNQMLVMLGAIAVLTGAVVGFFLSRQITRPLEDLVQASRQMEQGDFAFTIEVKGRDEVAELTRAFEHMRKTLLLSREGMLRSARLEAVGRLAGGVAHDFNNLVMIIKGYSDLLMESVPADNRHQIEEIKNAAERAAGLTGQLLAFSRKQVLEPQVLDLNHVVRGMLKMLRLLLGENIELLTSLSDQISRVNANQGQVEQVIMNLAVNARDALSGRGKLIIETQPCTLDAAYAARHTEVTPGSYVLLAVTDTGCGMSSETLAHIFEPFFTTKDAGKGTGLGLATVYGIVKQSTGHLSVYSEVGVGTTFKVYLPAVDQPVSAPQPEQRGENLKGTGTIVLVEDEAPLRTLAAKALERAGFQVLQAGSGLEALVVADRHAGDIHVVVTDIVMPRMGGPEMLTKLRRKRSGFAVIFMSGYTEAAALENAGIGKEAVLLNKPFSTDALVRKVLEVQQTAAALREPVPSPLPS